MCLSELKKSIDTQQVTTVAEFRRDLLLIFTNAIMYNPRSHIVNKMATVMAADVVPKMEELLAPPAKVEATPGKTLRSLRTTVKLEGTPTEKVKQRKVLEEFLVWNENFLEFAKKGKFRSGVRRKSET